MLPIIISHLFNKLLHNGFISISKNLTFVTDVLDSVPVSKCYILANSSAVCHPSQMAYCQCYFRNLTLSLCVL